MWYLITDILRRHPIVCGCFAVAMVGAVVVGVVVALTHGDGRDYIDGASLGLGLMAAFVPAVFLSVDLTQGAWDVLRMIPCRRRRLATAAWFSAAIGPVLVMFLALVPGFLANALVRPEAGLLFLRILVERLMLCLGVASFYCLMLSAIPFVKRLPEPIRSVCGGFIGACWGFGIAGASWGMSYLYKPEGAALRPAALALSVVFAVLAWPGLYALLRSGSGRTLWQQRQDPARARAAGPVRFGSRAAGVGAIWLTPIGIVLLLVFTTVGLAAYQQSHPEAKVIGQAVPILICGTVMLAFSGVSVVQSARLWRTLPLRPGRLAVLLLSLPMLMLAAAAVAGFCAARALGMNDLPATFFLIPCAVMCATALCEPLLLKFGPIGIFAAIMPSSFLMIIGAKGVLSDIHPIMALIGMAVLIGLSHRWLVHLLTRDAAIYRKALEFNARWNTGR